MSEGGTLACIFEVDTLANEKINISRDEREAHTQRLAISI